MARPYPSRRGARWQRGHRNEERFMNGSRRIGVAAAGARLALPAVRGQRAVEVAAAAVDVDVEGIERRPALAEGAAHHLGRGPDQLDCPGSGQGRGRLGVVHPDLPQRLVGVDVADAGDQVLVEQSPLDPGPFGPELRTVAARSNSGSNGSRPMCATSAGSSAPPGERDSPPNIRWSTKRSPGSPSVNRTRTRVLGASGAASSSSRNWPLIPRWASTASPSVNGSQRYLPRRFGSAKVRPSSCWAKSSAPDR